MIERAERFQCSSASRKFLNFHYYNSNYDAQSFSALQRAENSSIAYKPRARRSFPCFSALQRAENSSMTKRRTSKAARSCFSALQRAENSSIDLPALARVCQPRVSVLFSEPKIPQYAPSGALSPGAYSFQCSSASRKFLNSSSAVSSNVGREVSVLFSEPKIPQSYSCAMSEWDAASVSVLFSEPKIPQLVRIIPALGGVRRFSALQRAENSSISLKPYSGASASTFQCSSASRKFLNVHRLPHSTRVQFDVSVLFSEPKIPQLFLTLLPTLIEIGFSALQRAENSSMCVLVFDVGYRLVVSVLFSEPKIPQLF